MKPDAARYNKADKNKKQSFQVVATTAKQALGGPLDYNPRVSPALVKQGQELIFQGQELINQAATQPDPTKKNQMLFQGQQAISEGSALMEKVRDLQALLYVRKEDLTDPNKITGTLRAGVPIEPLILRAAAGDWIKIELYNALPEDLGSVTQQPRHVLRQQSFRTRFPTLHSLANFLAGWFTPPTAGV